MERKTKSYLLFIDWCWTRATIPARDFKLSLHTQWLSTKPAALALLQKSKIKNMVKNATPCISPDTDTPE
jgi:hypothetical protein